MSAWLPLPDRLLTIREVAATLGVSDKTVRRAIASAAMAATRVGNQWRVAPSDLRRYLRSGINRRWSIST